MPYKDIAKRRIAYRKWAAKNKEKRKNYQKILWEAKKHNKIPQKCEIEGCDKIGERHHPDYSQPRLIEWICRSHHRRVEHHTKCRICGENNVARGLCNKHYKSERRKIDPVYAAKCRAYVTKCRHK